MCRMTCCLGAFSWTFTCTRTRSLTRRGSRARALCCGAACRRGGWRGGWVLPVRSIEFRRAKDREGVRRGGGGGGRVCHDLNEQIYVWMNEWTFGEVWRVRFELIWTIRRKRRRACSCDERFLWYQNFVKIRTCDLTWGATELSMWQEKYMMTSLVANLQS